VNYFTLRIIISLMETIKDVYIRVGRALWTARSGGVLVLAPDMRLFSGEGLWNHLLRCRFALIGEGGRIPQDFGPLADPRFIRTETIMRDAEHIYSIAVNHAQTVQVCIDRLHELGANTQLKLLTGRLQKLAVQATPGDND
jgi:hypothetical protein